MSTKKKMVFVGFRMNDLHRKIISQLAKKWKCSESAVIRKLIEQA